MSRLKLLKSDIVLVNLLASRPLSISEMSSGSCPTLEGLLEEENFLVHVCQWKRWEASTRGYPPIVYVLVQQHMMRCSGPGFETALPEPHSTLTVSLNNRSNVAARGRCLRRIE